MYIILYTSSHHNMAWYRLLGFYGENFLKLFPKFPALNELNNIIYPSMQRKGASKILLF